MVTLLVHTDWPMNEEHYGKRMGTGYERHVAQLELTVEIVCSQVCEGLI